MTRPQPGRAERSGEPDDLAPVREPVVPEARLEPEVRVVSPQAKADMARSEELAGIAVPVWEVRHGHARELPAYVTAGEIPSVVDRIVSRFDDYADRWHTLPVGGSLTLTW